jgi:FkbM family methyltransferase
MYLAKRQVRRILWESEYIAFCILESLLGRKRCSELTPFRSHVDPVLGFFRTQHLSEENSLWFIDRMWQIVPDDSKAICAEVRRDYLRPAKGDLVLDAGAHYGLYTLLASHLVGGKGLVVSFEPSSKNYLGLLRNLKMNKVSNVKALRIAIGDFDGEGNLFLHRYSPGHSMILKGVDSFETVPVRKIDSIVDGLGLRRVDLVKIDCEGWELNVLRGAISTIERYQPRLIVAAYHYYGQVEETERWFKENSLPYTVTKSIPFSHGGILQMAPI